jgi:hypothetical protein
MTTTFNTKAEYKQSARVISDYKNDMIFEQPRDGLVQQEFVSYENVENGVKRTVIVRKFSSNGDYSDTTAISILPNNL